MAIAFVKALQASGGTSTTNNATVSVVTNGAVAAGNHIIGLATSRLTSTPTLSAVAATGATFQVDATLGGPSTESFGIFSAYLPSGLGSGVTVTATFTSSATRKTIALFEFSGIATSAWAYGGDTSNAASSSNPQTVASLTGLTIGDMVVGGMQMNASANAVHLSAGSGFTVPANGGRTIVGSSNWDEAALEYLLSLTSTTLTVSFANTDTGNYSGGAVAYKAAVSSITDSGTVAAQASPAGADALASSGTGSAQSSFAPSQPSAIGVPYAVGVGTEALNDATVALTTTAPVNPGDTLFLALATRIDSGDGVLASFDTVTADEIVSHVHPTLENTVSIARCYLSGLGLPSGTVINATLTSSMQRKTLIAFAVPNLPNASADTVAAYEDNLSVPLIDAPAPHAANALAVAVFSKSATSASESGTPGPGYTEIGDAIAGATACNLGYVEYSVLQTSSPQEASFTPSDGASNYTSMLAMWAGSARVTVDAIAEVGTSTAVVSQPVSDLTDSGESDAVGSATGTQAISDSGVSSAAASHSASQSTVDAGTCSALSSQTGTSALADAGTATATAVHTGATADSAVSSATGVFTASAAIQDASTALSHALISGSDALADSGTISSLESSTGTMSSTESGTCAAHALQSAFEAVLDASTAVSSASTAGLDALADSGEADALADQFGNGAEEGFASATVDATGTESLSDQGTNASIPLFGRSLDSIADSGTNIASAAIGESPNADSGTSVAQSTHTVTSESISDSGTLQAIQSTPNPVEQDTDQGTSTAIAAQTGADVIADHGTVVGTVSATTAAESAVDSGTSSGQSIGTGLDAIADTGTSSAIVVIQEDQFASGQSTATAVHSALESYTDQGEIDATASMPLAPLADSGTATAAASNPVLPPVVLDTFDRTTASGLGSTTPDAHVWTQQQGASTAIVANGGSALAQPVSVNTEIYTLDDDSADVEAQFDLTFLQFPVGTNFTIAPIVRFDPFNGGQYIRGTVSLTSGGGHIAVQLTKVIGGTGTSMTTASTVITTPLLNTPYRAKIRAVGSWVGFKVWDLSGAEPDWQIVGYLVPSDGVNDGATGLRLQTLAGTTTYPIFTIDNYMLTPIASTEAISENATSSGSASQSLADEAISDAGTNVAFGFAPLVDENDQGEVDATASQDQSFGAVYEVGECDAISIHTGLANTPDSGTNSGSASQTGTGQISDSGTNIALALSFAPPQSDAGEVEALASHSGIDAPAETGTSTSAASFDQSTGTAGENQVSAAVAIPSGTEQISDAGENNAVADFTALQAFVDSGESDAAVSPTAVEALADIGTSIASVATLPGDSAADSGTITAAAQITGSDAPAEVQITVAQATQQVLGESISEIGTEAALVSTPVPVQQDVDQGTSTSSASQSGAEQKVDQGSIAAKSTITGFGVVAALFDSGTSSATVIISGQPQIGADIGVVSGHATQTGSDQISDSGVSSASVTNPVVAIVLIQSGTNTATVIPALVQAFTDQSTSISTVIGSGGFGWSDSGVAVVDAMGSGEVALSDSTISATHASFSGSEQYNDSGTITAIALPSGSPSFAQSGVITATSTVFGTDSFSQSQIMVAQAVIAGFGAAAEIQTVLAHAILSGQDAKQDHGSISAHAAIAYTSALADSGVIAAEASFSGSHFYSDSGFSVALAALTGLEKFIDTGRNTAIISASAIESISTAGTVIAIGVPTGSQVFSQAGAVVAQAIASGSEAVGDFGTTAAVVILTHDEALREIGRVVADALVSGDQVLADAGFMVARAIHSGQFTWPDAGTNIATAIHSGVYDFNLVIKGVVSVSDWLVAAVFLLDRLSTTVDPTDSASSSAVHSDEAAGEVSTSDSEAYTVSVGDS